MPTLFPFRLPGTYSVFKPACRQAWIFSFLLETPLPCLTIIMAINEFSVSKDTGQLSNYFAQQW